MGTYLDMIKGPNDIKNIPVEEYPNLAKEIRKYLVKNVSETGGHLASNLGAVELTLALHHCLNLPEDKIIWDVGHQSYVHKILTGRSLKTLRQKDGLCGFPDELESDCDAFNTGHSTTSISVAAGYARARDILDKDYKVVAVIGDGSFSGGMAFEAINNLSRYKSNTIIILNDNEMSISKNVGGMAAYFERARTSSKYIDFKGGVEKTLNKTKMGTRLAKSILSAKNSVRDMLTPGDLFKDLGLGYFGPIDGHNLNDLIRVIEAAKTYKGTVVVHIITKKGKGYQFAEECPSKFHGIDPFDPATGELKKKSNKPKYTSVFGEKLCEMAREDKRIVAITAAMTDGTGLGAFAEEFPDRFFDVGIAEEHAVTTAAGMAAAGLRPFVAVYSTFLQRAYDQIIHDVALTNKPVVFAIDRAGIVGNDGRTHQGIYDIAYLSTIPNLAILCPKDGAELKKSLEYAKDYDAPIAVRYPRGEAYESGINGQDIELGKAELIAGGKELGIISVGSTFGDVAAAAQMLESLDDISVTLFNARFVAPIDTQMLDSMMNHKLIVSVEEGVKSGGFGEHVASYLLEHGFRGRFLNICIPDGFLEHGKPEELKAMLGLDKDGIYNRIKEVYFQK